MKDAFGGLFNIVVIGAFLMLLSSTFALIVSYTKAFKFKNIVISNYEKYEAANCEGLSGGSACSDNISKEAKSIAYSPNTTVKCHDGMELDSNGLFCYRPIVQKNGVIYEVVIQIDINFPLVNRLVAMRVFQVSGKTRVIVKR